MKLFSEPEAMHAEETSPQVQDDLARIRLNLGGVKAVIAIASAKGGVGKSAIVANVAAALALKGRKVGVLDADLNSPSIAGMLGMRRVRLYPGMEGVDPGSGPLGLRVVGADMMVESGPVPLAFAEEDVPVLSNGAPPVELTHNQMMRRLLGQTRFGSLDFLLIDVAPGLHEIDLIGKTAPLTGIVLVSHPTEQGVLSTKAALKVASEAGIPVAGIIENMTGFYCGNCHSVRPLLPHGDMASMVREKGPAIIGRLAFDPRMAESCDRGTQFVKEYPDAPLAKQLVEVASRLEELLVSQRHDQA
jgi:ATP-binding protein involved in chromosome partitioning